MRVAISEFKEFREFNDFPKLLNFLNLSTCVSLPTLRLSREQRLLVGFAEAEQGRVAEGKPMANG